MANLDGQSSVSELLLSRVFVVLAILFAISNAFLGYIRCGDDDAFWKIKGKTLLSITMTTKR